MSRCFLDPALPFFPCGWSKGERQRGTKDGKKTCSIGQAVLSGLCPLLSEERMASAKEELESQRVCPICLTSQSTRPTMVLMVAPCGHEMCDICLTGQFIAGRVSVLCPRQGCKFTLRRQDYQRKEFESGAVHKEMIVRKRDLKDFVLMEADFATLDEFNAYLEMVEDFAYNLVNEVDVEATRERIQIFLRDNKDRIEKARRARRREKEEADFMFAEYEREKKQKREAAQSTKAREQEEQRQQQEQMLRHVAKSGHMELPEQNRRNQTLFGEKVPTANIPAVYPLFRFHPAPRHVDTPRLVPPTPQLQQSARAFAVFPEEQAMCAAGATPLLFVRRALSEAFACLLDEHPLPPEPPLE
eukprot:m.71549 g.71549  ORF g.71549 m.71549 type:complete len:358 (-) comp12954_c0_seq1:54-1127(-)